MTWIDPSGSNYVLGSVRQHSASLIEKIHATAELFGGGFLAVVFFFAGWRLELIKAGNG